MPIFRYRAVTSSGAMLEGEMEARSQAAAIERLHELGHVPLDAEPVDAGETERWWQRDLFGGRGANQKQVLFFTRDLATLQSAGMPLDRSLEILIEQSENAVTAKLIENILERVKGGSSLADALAAEDGIFPRYYVSTVRAGEAGGSLDEVLKRLTEFLERMRATREQVKSALVYPAILLVFALAAIVILLTVVLPEFRPLFEDAGAALPATTQVVIFAADFLQAYWWAIILLFLAVALLLQQRLRKPAFRRRWDGWILRLPLFGDLITKVEVTRFARTLSSLLHNGVPLLTALSIVQDSLSNQALESAIDGVAEGVKEGQGLADPLSRTEVFPSLVVHLVRVGEKTGRLEPMLGKVADIFDIEVQRTTERMLAMLVPAVTLCLGAVIAMIIVSVLAAILSVNQLAF